MGWGRVPQLSPWHVLAQRFCLTEEGQVCDLEAPQELSQWSTAPHPWATEIQSRATARLLLRDARPRDRRSPPGTGAHPQGQALGAAWEEVPQRPGVGGGVLSC